jgi:macrolide transport system ATP-binding/permease protein
MGGCALRAVILSRKEWIFLLLEIKDLVKDFGDRRIVHIPRLVLAAGDKLAVVGENGGGKTTLLRMIAGEMTPDEGYVRAAGAVGMIPQLGDTDGADTRPVDPRIAGRLGLDMAHVMSGGEQTKMRIAAALARPCDILLADEPTTHLDIDGIAYLETLLSAFRGALVLVSHDRTLLSRVCNKVLDVSCGTWTLFGCGYDDHVREKQAQALHDARKYESYTAEKKRLTQAADAKAEKAAHMRKTPRRMGNSEARLHRKMGNQKAKANLQRAANAARTRAAQLEKAQKPWEPKPIVFDVPRCAVHSPWLITASGVSKSFGDREILSRCRFAIPNGQKTALVGANGAGKTTLLRMIADGTDGIERCRTLKIGFFRQDLGGIDVRQSVLENAMDGAIYDETFVRTVLARLLFRRDAMHMSAGRLSGGERVKLGIAKLMLGEFNLLVLDEPTSFLDIASRTALEDVMAAYDGAVLFVSHDRAFLSRVADRVIAINGGRTETFEDGWDAYAAAHGNA